ncbi:TRAP transporter substrate-binding protein [Martelella lutilitoris]|uniref:TRAP transporter substrate-binding protein n=1 Tax=Martelella lutilitoris TaxID=2583532 RepID=A0A5C4JVU6_9HYPH|nr:TRAP transporter substrate-binding protein [Martelella lutilitoris]TNB48779.1 TRAP transporter substrate-binding protein [Martelella lutilitoris]
MNTLNRRTLLKAGTLAALSVPYLARPAFAQTTVTVASLLGEDKPETKVWRFFAERAEERLPGRFRFNVVTNGALGGEKQVADSIRLGSVQASLSTVSALSAWVPELQLLDLPFLFRDPAHLRRVVTGPVGDDLKAQLAGERFIVGGFIDYGARHLLTKTPVTRPEELEGVTIRVINSPLHTGLWSAFGAVPVGIPITETYNALATGVADAMDLTKSAYAGFKLYEVVPCLTETGHIRASGVIYFSESFWNGLDAETQGLLMEISAEAALYFNALIVEDETAAMETARENGGEVFQPADMDAWRAGARGVWTEFAPVVGGMERIEMVEDA